MDRLFAWLVAAMIVTVVESAIAVNAAEPRPPNVLVIMADDLGFGDLGCYGGKVNRTPHLDRMAALGLRFTDFHSNGAMCSPTRAALLTGCYQQRFGRQFRGALGPEESPTNGLPPEAQTLPELLKPVGYATGMFGKWHLGNHPRLWPTRQGFDEFVGLATGDGDHHTRISRDGKLDWWRGEQLVQEPGYTADLITDHGIAFMRRHHERPWFLYLAHLSIHFPWQGPNDPPHRKPGVAYHDDKWGILPDRTNIRPHVRAMVENLDVNVGRVLTSLNDLGLRENTLVFFCSDNGGYLRYSGGFEHISSNGPLRGQKTDLYEGGHRVPAIAYWPTRIRPGVTPQTVMTMDLLPTILRLAQVPPERFPDTVDGIDCGPLLFQRKPLTPRILYWRAGRERQRVARDGPWKWLVNDLGPQLYHLHRDLGETTNRVEDHPETAERLERAWNAWDTNVSADSARYD